MFDTFNPATFYDVDGCLCEAASWLEAHKGVLASTFSGGCMGWEVSFWLDEKVNLNEITLPLISISTEKASDAMINAYLEDDVAGSPDSVVQDFMRDTTEALHGCAEWLMQFKTYLADEFRHGSPGWHIKFEAGCDGMFKDVRVRVNGMLRDVLLDYGKVRSGSEEDIGTYFVSSDDSKEDGHA